MKSDIWKHCGETMKSKVRILKSGGRYVYSNSERMSLLWWRSVREINYEKVSGRGLLLILSVRSRCRCCFWISASSVCCITAQRTHDFTSHSTHVRYNSYSLRSAREHFLQHFKPWYLRMSVISLECLSSKPHSRLFTSPDAPVSLFWKRRFHPVPERCLCTYRVWNLFRFS